MNAPKLAVVSMDIRRDLILPMRSFSEFLTASRLSREFFEKMFIALESQSAWRAWWRKKQLQRRLRPFQRCGWSVRFTRPLVARLKRRWRAIRGGVHGGMPASGGMVLAVVGCDGSGKSTMVQELTRWLNTHYAVQTYHLGKPRRSRLNYIMLRFAGVLGRLSIKVHSSRVGILADLANVPARPTVRGTGRQVHADARAGGLPCRAARSRPCPRGAPGGSRRAAATRLGVLRQRRLCIGPAAWHPRRRSQQRRQAGGGCVLGVQAEECLGHGASPEAGAFFSCFGTACFQPFTHS